MEELAQGQLLTIVTDLDLTQCPLCDASLVILGETGIDVEYQCFNEHCPYTLYPEVRDVINGLTESGMNIITAAEIARQHTVEFLAEVTAEKSKFAVTDMASADWVLKIMAEIQHEIDLVSAHIAEEKLAIEFQLTAIAQRGESLLEPLRRKLAFFDSAFTPQLENWTKTELAGGKAKSKKLLYGKLSFKAGSERLIVDNEEEAIAAAKIGQFDDCIRTKEEISKTALKSLLKDNDVAQVIFAGSAHIEKSPETFNVEPILPGVM